MFGFKVVTGLLLVVSGIFMNKVMEIIGRVSISIFIIFFSIVLELRCVFFFFQNNNIYNYNLTINEFVL